MRLAAAEEVKTNRVKELQALQNKRKRELEDVTIFLRDLTYPLVSWELFNTNEIF